MSLKIAFHIACQLSTSEMDVDRATLAVVYRLGYSIFWKEYKLAVLEFAVYLNSQSSWCDVTVISKYWNQNSIGNLPEYFLLSKK